MKEVTEYWETCHNILLTVYNGLQLYIGGSGIIALVVCQGEESIQANADNTNPLA